jgi:hypothetical protein
MIQQYYLFIDTFARQVKQILQIHAVKGTSAVLTVTLKASLMISDSDVQRLGLGFTTWVQGGTYNNTEKQMIGTISDQDVNGSITVTILVDPFVIPGEIATDPEFNTSYAIGQQIEANVTEPFVSLTGAKYATEFGTPLPSNNDSFTTTSTSTTTTTTHATTTTTTAH